MNITENVPLSPSGMKGMALAQCEDLCTSFRKNRDSDIMVVRVDHYYMIPRKLDEVNDICSSMCLEALKTEKITVNNEWRLSLLYESDAVEFIFKLIRCTEHEYPVYNLSSSQELTEFGIAECIQEFMEQLLYDKDEDEDEGPHIKIEKRDEEARRCVLDNRRFDEEFGVKIFADTRETIEKVVKYMVAHKDVFLTGEEEKKGFWRRFKERAGWLVRALIPYLENLICFILVLLLSGSSLGSRYFSELDFYLLYVLLFAVVYGQHQATFSALLAVVGSFILQVRDRTFLTVALDYNTYIWIAQLFIVGLVVGYLKDQIRKLQLESEEEQQFLSHQLSDIKDINGTNIRIKDALETEIINQRDSVGKVYQITSKLEQYMPEEVLFYAAETMREILRSDDIAIYTVSNDTYARLFSFTSEQAKTLGKSIRYREMGEVYDTLMTGKVYINRNLDSRYPMMANAIFDDDRIQTLIMVWGLPWERMTLGQADMLTIVSYLIQNAILRAARYLTMLENQRYQDYGHVMKQEAFTPLVHAFLSARNKNLTECAILQIVLPEDEQTEEEPAVQTPDVPVPERKKERERKRFFRFSFSFNQNGSGANAGSSDNEQNANSTDNEAPGALVESGGKYADIGNVLAKKIRQEDYIGVLEDGNLYILLSNTSDTDAMYVVRRIEDEGYTCILLEDFAL